MCSWGGGGGGGGTDLRGASGMGKVMLKRMRLWKAVSMASGLLVISTTMPMWLSRWCSSTPAGTPFCSARSLSADVGFKV